MYFDHIYPSLLQDPPPPGEHLNDHTQGIALSDPIRAQ